MSRRTSVGRPRHKVPQSAWSSLGTCIGPCVRPVSFSALDYIVKLLKSGLETSFRIGHAEIDDLLLPREGLSGKVCG